MAENQQNGNGDAPQLTEQELEQDINLPQGIDPDNATPDQVRELVKTSQTALAQKKHWRNKALDPASGKPYKELVKPATDASLPTNQTPSAETKPEAEARITRLEQAEEKRQFGHAHGLSPEETDHVFAYAQGSGLKPSDALEKPFMKTALETFRTQQRTNDATPGPSSRSPVVEGKSFSEMKPEDKRKNFSKVVENLTKK